MSMLLMVQAMKIKVGNPTRKLVLIKLADNANDDGVCWPSYQNIADHCEVSKRSIMSHVKALEEMGLLRRQFRKNEDGTGNQSNYYHLSLDGENISPPSENISLPLVKMVHHPSENGSLPPSENISPRTSHSLEPVIEPKRSLVTSETKRSKFKFNDDDLKLAEWMLGRVQVINPTAKNPNTESWANTIRLMREIDNRTHSEITGLFDWANKDSFWCSNILSPEKLRKQWDKLTAKKICNSQQPANQCVNYVGNNFAPPKGWK